MERDDVDSVVCWGLHVLEDSAMEGPGLVRWVAAHVAVSLRRPHTVWDWASVVRG